MPAQLDALCDLVSTNKVAFKKQYDRRWVQVRAEVESVGETVLGRKYVVHPRIEGHYTCTHLNFSKSKLRDADSFGAGDQVEAICRVIYADSLGVAVSFILSDCTKA